MTGYLLRRLLLIIPTLFGIIAINFVVVQFAPGGPVEQMVAELKGKGETAGRLTGMGGAEAAGPRPRAGIAAHGPRPQVIEQSRSCSASISLRSSGSRIWLLIISASTLAAASFAAIRFGISSSEDAGQHLDRIMVYAARLSRVDPLGDRKATRDGTRFDLASSAIVLIGYAIPSFLFAILLVVLFAGGSFVQWFPLRGLTSEGSSHWAWGARILDYGWHMVLPTIALVAGGFASLTILTKNCFLEEVRKQYVVTAKAKGASEQRVLYGHVFRNAMLLIVAGFPAAFIGILFSSALLVEIIFSLDGLGLLGFEAAIRRDYPVMFGTLYIFTLLGLMLQIVGDLMYTVVDPRIDFEARG